MKKKVLMSLVLLIAIGTSAAFAQNTAKYYLEIWDITQATYNALNAPSRVNDRTLKAEDDYFLARTASGTNLRWKESGLTLEQARQKLVDVDSKNTAYTNLVYNNFIKAFEQQNYFVSSNFFSGTNFRIFCWMRRIE